MVRRPHNQRVVIYDPNNINPYGTELAIALSQDKRTDVLLVIPRDKPTRTLQNVSVKRVLTPLRAGRISKIWARLLSPLRTITLAGTQPLVIVWTRDVVDAGTFALRAVLGLPTAFVYHNPPGTRTRRGLNGWAERFLARVALTCFHSEWMRDRTSRTVRGGWVTPHPPYSVVLTNAEIRAARGGDRRNRVAFIGALRPDKGAALLKDIAAASRGGWELRIAGPDKMATAEVERLRAMGVKVVHPFDEAPSDHDLQAEIMTCNVVIAPYQAVSESGSVILAESLGIPTLGLRSEGLEASLNSKSLANDADSLGKLLTLFLEKPWSTYKLEPGARLKGTQCAWKEVFSLE